MLARVLTGFLGGAACLLFASVSHAACSKDNECPGELVCEDGTCVAAPPAPAPAASPPRVAAPAAAPAAAPPLVRRSIDAEPVEEQAAPPTKPRGKRHSTGMMVGGIVITSFSGISLGVAMVGVLCGMSLDGSQGSESGSNCDGSSLFLGGMAVTGILLGVGIPLIVVGSQREGAPSASVAPWVTPSSAGLGLRLNL
jgi:hypothetical protein